MELRHLRNFLVLAEELHFGRAARRLSMSQPPLSLSIRQLEESLGVVLFERTSKGATLTPAGTALREHAQQLMLRFEQTRDVVRAYQSGQRGVVRVGFVGSMLYRGLPRLLEAFETAQPALRVELSELNSREQIDAVLHERLDLGFVLTGQLPATLDHLLLQSEPFVACVPHGHRLADRRRVSVGELADEAFVLFARAASPDYYERVVSLCIAEGVHPNVVHEVRHWLSVVSLVAQRMGVALVPQAMAAAGVEGARFVPLTRSSVSSETYCIWSRDRLGPAAERFLADVRDFWQRD